MPVCATRIYRGETVSAVPYLALISALAGLGLAAYYYKAVEAAPAGNDRMVFLMTEIQKGQLQEVCHKLRLLSILMLMELLMFQQKIKGLAKSKKFKFKLQVV